MKGPHYGATTTTTTALFCFSPSMNEQVPGVLFLADLEVKGICLLKFMNGSVTNQLLLFLFFQSFRPRKKQ